MLSVQILPLEFCLSEPVPFKGWEARAEREPRGIPWMLDPAAPEATYSRTFPFP